MSLINFEWLDYRSLFWAKLDAERERHFETLPVLWQQLRRAYLQGCWRARQWMSMVFARECLQLKEWENAVHHALLGQDDKLMTLIAEGLLGARVAELVEQVVNRLLTTANLRTHFVLACKLLARVADAIPDALIPKVGEWLLKRAREVRKVQFGANHVSAAWETMAVVAPRFPCDLARSVIAVAVAHPVWTTKLDDPNRFIPERSDVLRTLLPLVWILPPSDIPPLASATLPLLTDRQQVSDYDEVVNLLCNLAKRGGKEVTDSLAASLYPSGQPVSRILAQVAGLFGKGEILAPVRLQRLAHQVTQEIRRQVQWLQPGQLPEPVAEQIMEFSSPKPDRTLKVYLVGLTGLHVLIKRRAELDEPSLVGLLDAILDLARSKDNFCTNREALLDALVRLADVIPTTARTRIEAALGPLALGAVEESSEYATAAETDNPLNPIKCHSGRPEDVQATALVALAALASGNAVAAKRAGGILEDALCDHRPKIRQAAYEAARRLPDVSEGVILGVLAGLRDPDQNAAASAFAALADQKGWKLNRNHWRVFLMAARLAQRIGGVKLRQCAAKALVAWSPNCPPPLTRGQTELLAELTDDICWSVRTVAKHRSSELRRS
jgi:hypothetical protein